MSEKRPRTSRPSLLEAGTAIVLLSLVAACGLSAAGAGPESSAGDASATGDPSASGDPTATHDGRSSTADGTVSDDGSADSSAGDGSTTDTGTTTTVVPGVPVDLGTAGAFVILTKTGISTVPTSAIVGNVGVSPAAAGSITGFPLVADFTNLFSLTPQITGKVYASDYAVPTPSTLTTAISDMETAFIAGAARTPDVTELGAGNIGGLTLAPGVYKWSSGVLVPTDVTLNGNATDVWIFQIAQTLDISADTKVVLSGTARSKNVFWQVAGLVNLNTGAHLEGIVLAQTAVTLGTGTSINGRLLAQTAVTLAGSTIVQPF